MADPSYKTYKYTLEPKEVLPVTRTASFVSCLASSFPFKLSMNDGADNDFEAGITFSQDEDFSRLQIHNPSSTEELVVAIALGRGEITDSRLTLGGQVKVDVQNDELPVRVLNSELQVRVVNPPSQAVSVSGTADVELKNTVLPRERVPEVLDGKPKQTVAAGQTRIILAANAKRREVILVNSGLKTVFIMGTSITTAGHGVPLDPGQSLTLKTTAAIWARNEEDAATDINSCELEWS